MSLFQDGPISTSEDLRAYESSILDVASSEGIDLTTKLALAQRELEVEILGFLVAETAVGDQAPKVTLSQVAVTNELLQWHSLRALALTFRDAHYNQLNDRYEAKWLEYEKQAAAAAARFFETGVSVVRYPIRRANTPIVSSAPGILSPGIFEIRTTWQNVQGQEGSPSNQVVFSTEDGSVPVVDSLTGLGDGAAWNVYVGPLGGTLTRQNATSIPVGQTWAAPATGFTSGSMIGAGQEPDFYLRKGRTLVRG